MFQRRSQRTERIACSLSCPLMPTRRRLGCGRHAGPCPVPALPGAALAPSGQSARRSASPHHIPKTRAFEPSTSCSRSQGPAGMHSQRALPRWALSAAPRTTTGAIKSLSARPPPCRPLLFIHYSPPLPPGTFRRDRYHRSPSSPQPVSRAVRLPTPLHTTTNLTSSSRTATTTAPVCRNQPAASAPPAPNHSQHQAVRDSHPSRPVSFSLCCQQYRSLCLLNSPPPSRYIYLYLSAGREVTDLICQSLQASSFFRHCPTNPKAIPRHIDHELTPSFHQASTLPDPGSALPSSILTWPLASINLGPSSTCQAATRTPS